MPITSLRSTKSLLPAVCEAAYRYYDAAKVKSEERCGALLTSRINNYLNTAQEESRHHRGITLANKYSVLRQEVLGYIGAEESKRGNFTISFNIEPAALNAILLKIDSVKNLFLRRHSCPF